MVSTSAILSLFLCVTTCQALGFTTPMKAKRRQSSQLAEWFDFKPAQGGYSGKDTLYGQMKGQQKSFSIHQGSKWYMNSKTNNNKVVEVDEFIVTVKIEGKATEIDELTRTSFVKFRSSE